MTLQNLLDLRKKDYSQTKIVERIIIKQRSLWSETFRIVLVIAIVSTVIYGISFADINPFSAPADQTVQPEVKTFSAIGLVSNINSQTLVLNSAQATTEASSSIFTIDLSNVNKTETDQYLPINISDIKVGDNVIVQGDDTDSGLLAKRIVSFSYVPTIIKDVIASSTEATSTVLENSSSTEVLSTTTTTTDVVSTTTASSTLTEVIENILSSVVDIFTGTTSTSSEVISSELSTSTNASSTSTNIEFATSSATTSEIVSTETSTTTKIIETVKNVVGNIIDSITGNSSEDTNSTSTVRAENFSSEIISESQSVSSNSTSSDTTETTVDSSTN